MLIYAKEEKRYRSKSIPRAKKKKKQKGAKLAIYLYIQKTTRNLTDISLSHDFKY